MQEFCTYGTICFGVEREEVLQGKRDWYHEVVKKVRKHAESGKYRLTEHVLLRIKQRSLDLLDVIHVLKKGYHEENKTMFNTKMQCWNYAIRGKALDGAEARIIVAFERDMIIITAIRLTKGKK